MTYNIDKKIVKNIAFYQTDITGNDFRFDRICIRICNSLYPCTLGYMIVQMELIIIYVYQVKYLQIGNLIPAIFTVLNIIHLIMDQMSVEKCPSGYFCPRRDEEPVEDLRHAVNVLLVIIQHI